MKSQKSWIQNQALSAGELQSAITTGDDPVSAVHHRNKSVLDSVLWPILLVIVVVEAGMIALSRVHGAHNSDTLLWTLISVDRLVPFYWNENRIGTLVPWVTAFVRDPYANAQFQVFICSLSLLFCPVLVGVLTSRPSRFNGLLVAQQALAFAILCFLFRFDDHSCIQILFLGHPYGLALCLALSTLFVAQRMHIGPLCLIAIFVLGFMVAWINIALVVFLVPAMALLMRPPNDRTRRLIWQALLVGAVCSAAAVEYAISRQYSGADFMVVGGLKSIPDTLFRLGENTFAFMLSPVTFGVVLLTGVSVLFLRGAPLLLDYRRVLSLGIAVVILCLAIAYSGWPARNTYHHRYLAAPAIAICILISFAAADALLAWMRAAHWSNLNVSIFTCLLFALVMSVEIAAFGRPSPASARHALESRISTDRLSLYSAECTHLMGNYWLVWPRVFDHNAAFPHQRVWGIAPRAEVTRDLWDVWPQAARVYCAVNGDTDVSSAAKMFGVPVLVPTGTFGNIVRFGLAPKPVYDYGHILTFTKDGNGTVYELQGWGKPEPGGTWTLGSRSKLLISLREPPVSDLLMTLEAHLFVAPQRPVLPVSLTVDGRPLANWQFTNSEPLIRRQININKELAADSVLEITFSNHDPRSPAELGISADARPLGLALHTIRFDQEQDLAWHSR